MSKPERWLVWMYHGDQVEKHEVDDLYVWRADGREMPPRETPIFSTSLLTQSTGSNPSAGPTPDANPGESALPESEAPTKSPPSSGGSPGDYSNSIPLGPMPGVSPAGPPAPSNPFLTFTTPEPCPPTKSGQRRWTLPPPYQTLSLAL